MQRLKKASKAASIIFIGVLLSACGRQNPLLDDEDGKKMSELRSSYSFVWDENTRLCPEYYAGIKKPEMTLELGKRCEALLKKDYRVEKRFHETAMKDATYEDLRDPKFWQKFVG